MSPHSNRRPGEPPPVGPRDRHGSHLVWGTFHGFVASAVSLPAGLITAAFLTRQLGPLNYGLLVLAGGIIVWVEGMVTLGFNRTAIKLMTESGDQRPIAIRYLQIQLLVALAATALLVGAAPLLSSLLGAVELTRYLRIYALGIPLTALLSVHRAVLISNGFFIRRALVDAFYWGFRMVMVILFVTLRPTVTQVILATLVSTASSVFLARLYVRPVLIGSSAFPYRNLLAYAWPLFFYQVSINLFNRLDLFFVKALSDLPGIAGFYGAAHNLTVVPAIFAGAFSPLLLAKLSELRGRALEQDARALVAGAVRFVICLLPFAGMAAAASGEVVSAIYGPAFSQAAPFLRVLIFAAVGLAMITVCSSVFIAQGRPGLPLALVGPFILVTPALHYVAISRFGPVAAPGVTTGVVWLCAAVALGLVRVHWQVGPSPVTLLRSASVCALAYALTRFWSASGPALFLELPAVSVAIVAAFLVTGEIRRRDIAFVRSLFSRTSGNATDPKGPLP